MGTNDSICVGLGFDADLGAVGVCDAQVEVLKDERWESTVCMLEGVGFRNDIKRTRNSA